MSFSNPYEYNLHMLQPLKELASPLLDQHLPGGDMGYLRFYPDGTSLRLGVQKYWTSEFFNQKHYNHISHKVFGFEHVNKKLNYSLVTGKPEGEVPLRHFHKAKLWNQFLMHRYTPEYVDFFAITAAADDNNAPNFYLNNLALIERYRDSFLEIIGAEITTPHKNALIHSTQSENIQQLFRDIQTHKDTQRYELVPGIHLTDREYQVLKRTAFGQPAKEAAYNLNLSPKTVERHLENIRTKSGLTNRSQLIQAFFDGPLIQFKKAVE